MAMQVLPQTGAESPNSVEQLSPPGNEFPRQAGQTLKVSKRDNGLISPAKSTFSFNDDEPEPEPVSNLPDLFDKKQISQQITRGAPGDAALMSMVQRNQEGTDLARRKSQFYSEVFAYREPNLSPREKICRNSVITAEVKTNVIVRIYSTRPALSRRADKYSFVGERRIRFSERSLPASVPTVPETFLLHFHNPRPLCLFTVRWYLRVSLHPHHNRFTITTPTGNEQAQHSPRPSLHD